MSDINIGQITEALNDKADRDLMNVDSANGADAVIDYQEPTSANNYTWYRKYASGWVEQGGSSTAETETRFYFPIQMADTNYTVFALGGGHTGSGADIAMYVWARDTTYIEFSRDRSTYLQWEVKGMAAN